MKKLGKKFPPITKKSQEVNKSTQKLEEVINKGSSEKENNQEIVPVNTEDEN